MTQSKKISYRKKHVTSKIFNYSSIITLFILALDRVSIAEQVNNNKNLPDYISIERKISQENLKKKKSGIFVTGIPSFSSDPLNGFGIGATGYIFFNGNSDDLLFAYTPYFLRAGLNLKYSTGNSQEVRLKLDAPYVFNSPWRLKIDGVYSSSPNNVYFGLTEQTLNSFTQGNYESYSKSLGTIRSGMNGEASKVADVLRNKFLEREWMINLKGERSLFDGNWRFIMGYELQHLSYKTFENEIIQATDPTTGKIISVPNGKSLLQQDVENKKVFGINGGLLSIIQAGLIYDTRDFESDPSKGIVAELSDEISAPVIGSSYLFNKALFQFKYYHQIAPEIFPKTVLATRIGYGTIMGEQAPFFEFQDQWSPDGSIKALGGSQTLRGYKENRFLGRTVAYANIELRHKVGELNVFGQNFNFGIVPFIDLGTVGDQIFQVNLSQTKASTGIGLRVAWNLSTILTFDFSISPEDKQFFLNFNNSF
jgi:hypothetical protein